MPGMTLDESRASPRRRSCGPSGGCSRCSAAGSPTTPEPAVEARARPAEPAPRRARGRARRAAPRHQGPRSRATLVGPRRRRRPRRSSSSRRLPQPRPSAARRPRRGASHGAPRAPSRPTSRDASRGARRARHPGRRPRCSPRTRAGFDELDGRRAPVDSPVPVAARDPGACPSSLWKARLDGSFMVREATTPTSL